MPEATKPAPEVTGKQVPHIRRVSPRVDHGVAEERLPVPPDPHETGWGAPLGSVIVQPRHDVPEPPQVHRPGRGTVDTAIHPAQHRAHPRLRHARGGSHRRELPIDRAQRCGDEQVSSGPQRRQPVQFRADRGGRVDIALVTCRAVHTQQEPVTAIRGCRVDPERGVLLIGDKPQPRICQGIRVKCPHGISAIYDAAGRVLARASSFDGPVSLVADVPPEARCPRRTFHPVGQPAPPPNSQGPSLSFYPPPGGGPEARS